MKLYRYLFILYFFSCAYFMHTMNEKTPLLQKIKKPFNVQYDKTNENIVKIYKTIGESSIYTTAQKCNMIKQYLEKNKNLSYQDRYELYFLYRLMQCKDSDSIITVHTFIRFDKKMDNLLYISTKNNLENFLAAINQNIIKDEIKRLKQIVIFFKENFLAIDNKGNILEQSPCHHLEPRIDLLKKYIRK